MSVTFLGLELIRLTEMTPRSGQSYFKLLLNILATLKMKIDSLRKLKSTKIPKKVLDTSLN